MFDHPEFMVTPQPFHRLLFALCMTFDRESIEHGEAVTKPGFLNGQTRFFENYFLRMTRFYDRKEVPVAFVSYPVLIVIAGPDSSAGQLEDDRLTVVSSTTEPESSAGPG